MPGILDGWLSLGRDINRAKDGEKENQEGVVGEKMSSLTLDIDDAELIQLKKKWEQAWEGPSKDLQKRQERAEKYWRGKPKSLEETALSFLDERPVADNLIFEAVETFLPIVTRQNPEPVVFSDETQDSNSLAEKTRKVLISLADSGHLKLKVQDMVRHWSLYFLGAMKFGWSEREGEIDFKVVRPQRLVLDDEATVSPSGEYLGKYIGEVRDDSAEDLVSRFPEHEAFIREKVSGKMGTRIRYTEWWTDEMLFYTLGDKVLAKSRNPHWNYEEEVPQMDEYGVETVRKIAGWNHFKYPKKPYVFLTVFGLGLHPYDEVSIIEQNMSLQDMVVKRLEQIDRNADMTNGGIVVSGAASGLSKEEAAQASEALKSGGTIYVTGDAGSAVMRQTGTPMPSFVYDSLIDYRNELRSVFGVRASTAEGVVSTDTVRGKILAKSQDESRMAIVASRIEQVADTVFNWMVQLMCVYYDEPHLASYVGDEKTQEFVRVSRGDFRGKLVVSVKEGSMVPKDPLTKRNEAIDLWSANALDPVTLFERLDFPNPRDAAMKLYTWQSNPGALFPGAAAVPPMGGPSGEPKAPQGEEAKIPPQSPSAAVEVPLAQADISNVPIQ